MDYIRTITNRYCKDNHFKHEEAIRCRLRRNQNKQSFHIRNIIYDRIKYIMKIFMLIFLVRVTVNKEKTHESFFIDNVYDANRNNIRQYYIKSIYCKKVIPLYQSSRVDVSNVCEGLMFAYLWLTDFLLAITSLADLNSYMVYGLHNFIYAKNIIKISKPRTIHIFSIYKADKYILSACDFKDTVKYIYFSNAQVKFRANGYFSNLNLIIPGPAHLKELELLIYRGHMIIKNVEIITNGNEFGLYIDKFSKEMKYELGFFSEGHWARSAEGKSIEGIDSLYIHLNKPLSNRAKLEHLLFNKCIEISLSYNLKLAIYPHPCEIRLLEKGFKLKYEQYINNKQIYYGEKYKGFSNIYESMIGIVAIPNSSIVYDRFNVGRITITSGNILVNRHELLSSTLDLGPYLIEINDIDQLDEVVMNIACKQD